ncbi:MAG: hypothetical protein OXI79_00235 [Gammaproteobacteria bacterium]|nr:hypothetical protein [Gammaproteobacteria bacterium]
MGFFDRKSRLADAERRIEELEAENRGYTEIVTNALLDAATDGTAEGYVAALEIAAGQLARAFSAAEIGGRDAAYFGHDALGQIGRSMVETGEAVWYRQGRRLKRADNFGIEPGEKYQLSTPDGDMVVAASRVFHARWSLELSSGRGVGPLGKARTLRQLTSRLEGSLATESNATVGYLLPIPADGDAANVTQLKADLKDLKGRIAVIETTADAWAAEASRGPRRDFQLSRMGPDYPDSSVNLYAVARDTTLAACGYPVQLVTNSDGTAQREAWRRYLHGTVSPLARVVTEAAAGAGLDLELSFDALFASDIQGRARAFQSLVKGGMEIDQAVRASGLLVEE